MPLLVSDFTVCNATHGFEILICKLSPFESHYPSHSGWVFCSPNACPYPALNAHENLSLFDVVFDESHSQGFWFCFVVSVKWEKWNQGPVWSATLEKRDISKTGNT